MRKVDLAIKNGRIITADGEIQGDVYVTSGKIIGLGHPDTEYEMTNEMVKSKAGWTPYAGRIFCGSTRAV